jgi:hypothetical protein
MAYPVEFKGANGNLSKPNGMDDLQCCSLPVFKNGVNCVSCWELTEEDLLEIAKTKRIYVSVWSGKTQPLIAVGNENSIRLLIADYGVWEK